LHIKLHTTRPRAQGQRNQIAEAAAQQGVLVGKELIKGLGSDRAVAP
jgi:hypothetical protein